MFNKPYTDLAVSIDKCMEHKRKLVLFRVRGFPWGLLKTSFLGVIIFCFIYIHLLSLEKRPKNYTLMSAFFYIDINHTKWTMKTLCKWETTQSSSLSLSFVLVDGTILARKKKLNSERQSLARGCFTQASLTRGYQKVRRLSL